MPLMRSSSVSLPGRTSAIICSVASLKTTKAGTFSSSARVLRHSRSRSKSASS